MSFKHDPDEAWQKLDRIDDLTFKEFVFAVVVALATIAVVTTAIYSLISWWQS